MNRLTRHTKPDATVERYRFNKGGLPEAVSALVRGSGDWVEFVSDINYNAKGQRTDVYFGNNSKTAYTYDAQTFRLTRLLTTRNEGQGILQDLNYTYDPEGNIVQVTDGVHQDYYFDDSLITPDSKYAYDALYRLVSATGRELKNLGKASASDFPNSVPVPNMASDALQSYTQQYEYDALGNILQMQSFNRWTRDYIYDTATNRLLRHEGSVNVYTYDTHGNMLSMPHLTQMLWDAKDRLLKTSLNPAQGGTADDTNTTWYRYDLSGQRVRKICIKNNITEERIYLSGCEIYRRTNSGVLQTERQTLHINDDQKKIAFVETLTVADSHPLTTPESLIRYQCDNHLGSACLELDASAAIISYEEYHPFGTTSYRSGRSAAEVSLKRYKYVGKERDEESGLYYYGARYYAAWLCRFVSVDPLQFKYPHYTSYQYAGNKPISYIDLDGLEENKNNTTQIDRLERKEVKEIPVNTKTEKPIFGKIEIEGSEKFKADTLNSLEKIKQTNEGFSLYISIIASGKTITIHQIGSEETNLTKTNIDCDRKIQKWNLGDIGFTGQRKNNFQDFGENGWLALGHELSHTVDVLQGKVSEEQWRTPDHYIFLADGSKWQVPKLNVDEVRAMDRENKIRAQSGERIREFYSTVVDRTHDKEQYFIPIQRVAKSGKGIHPDYKTNYKNNFNNN